MLDGSNKIVEAVSGMGSSSVFVFPLEADNGPGAVCVCSNFTGELPQQDCWVV
jgi:hypothetical protein